MLAELAAFAAIGAFFWLLKILAQAFDDSKLARDRGRSQDANEFLQESSSVPRPEGRTQCPACLRVVEMGATNQCPECGERVDEQGALNPRVSTVTSREGGSSSTSQARGPSEQDRLSDLHRQGALSNAEFETATRQLRAIPPASTAGTTSAKAEAQNDSELDEVEPSETGRDEQIGRPLGSRLEGLLMLATFIAGVILIFNLWLVTPWSGSEWRQYRDADKVEAQVKEFVSLGRGLVLAGSRGREAIWRDHYSFVIECRGRDLRAYSSEPHASGASVQVLKDLADDERYQTESGSQHSMSLDPPVSPWGTALGAGQFMAVMVIAAGVRRMVAR
jgi:hypothetical protein